ncbi:hypothetical protein F4821DRAFT_237263 [Hypoxylon rubiginosum]|uniref:Uncharacterized protein n=1 Tax=Hypoxylon rubiginosum TaxID=110542 RepID=A0ACC0D2G6_9PEZI|nr:hypothetical protein F4821DRAFT_237263 [Hypoxylon rubiginosum]
MDSTMNLPASDSLNLVLDHPTPNECTKIWSNTAASWKDSLTVPVYLTESQFLNTIPLAANEGMTTWILVEKNHAPDERQILCSCESYRKRSLVSDSEGNVEDCIIHGIASVFCPPEYRRHGYAARHMTEIAGALRNWQNEYGKSVGSILYSDIGKVFYARLGWTPNVTNCHLAFSPIKSGWPSKARRIYEKDIGGLCQRDEAIVRAAMAKPDSTAKKRVTILPDLDHMLWHIRKEDFATRHIFGRIPDAKGAIASFQGKDVWAIWTHRYYHHPDNGPGENVLYILRLVLEGDETANRPVSKKALEIPGNGTDEQVSTLQAVLQAAQAEAQEWKLDHVKLWDPTPLVHSLIVKAGFEYVEVERESESIASGLWYNDDGEADESPSWINNEHYAWC